jgi:cell wall-associated NlpC family hydrolase
MIYMKSSLRKIIIRKDIVSITSKSKAKDNSALRKEIVKYALQFKGNPYAYGGSSLTKGTDCSGFTQSVFKSKGINIPRTSKEQAKGGKNVPLKKLQPGDLIFYTKNGQVNHVALYIGKKEVIHASNPESGIKVSKYNYREPYKAVSYLD